MEEEKQELALGKVDNIASGIIVEDALKGMLLKTKNINFKPWKNDYAPRNPHSAFGDFPKEYLPKKKAPRRKRVNFEQSQSASTINKFILRGRGTGGNAVHRNKRK
jgi:hypothetical protein